MLQIDFKFPDWAAKIKKNEERINLFIAAQVQTNRGLLFDAEGSYNGHPAWAPLKFRQGQVLSQRGTLRKSIAPYNSKGRPGPDGIVQFQGDTITIGTTLLYARMMNEGTEKMPGGVLKPKNAKALRIPLPSGAGASQIAKELRAGKISKSIQKQKDKIALAEARFAKTKQRFAKQVKKDRDTSATSKTWDKQADSIYMQKSKLAKLEARRQQILDSGKGGEKFIFRKSVRIPARNFTDWNTMDQQELDAALLNLITGILNE